LFFPNGHFSQKKVKNKKFTARLSKTSAEKWEHKDVIEYREHPVNKGHTRAVWRLQQPLFQAFSQCAFVSPRRPLCWRSNLFALRGRV
jgi:hypothetical protein